MTREEQIRKAAYSDKNNLHAQPHPVPGVAEMMNEYFALCFKAGAEWADSHPHWIPIDEELPPENGKTQQSISVWATNGLMSGEFRYNFDTKTWTDMWGDPFDITHWMLLPQPPRKEE